jgi:hypothetical protein
VHAKEGVAFLLAQGLIAEESPGEVARVFHTVEVLGRCRRGNTSTPQPNHAPNFLMRPTNRCRALIAFRIARAGPVEAAHRRVPG